ncbi:MAG: hypothetical protein ACXVNQ_06715 [Bacteroidia bacterium]
MAQTNEIIRPGLVRLMGTISTSKMLNNKESGFYLHGNLEIYFNKRVSFCGDAYYFLNAQKGNSYFDMNHNIFYGLLWHFTKKSNDLYVGIQPGIAITKLKTNQVDMVVTQTGINPVFSSVIGYNFYVNKFFNFFLQSRLILGEHNYDIHRSLSELRFSAGLGFNINCLKPKKTD